MNAVQDLPFSYLMQFIDDVPILEGQAQSCITLSDHLLGQSNARVCASDLAAYVDALVQHKHFRSITVEIQRSCLLLKGRIARDFLGDFRIEREALLSLHALNMDRGVGKKEELIDSHKALGYHYYKTRNFFDANTHFERAAHLMQDTKNETERITMLRMCGESLIEENGVASALIRLNEARRLADHMQDTTEQGWIAIALGACYAFQHEKEAMQAQFLKAHEAIDSLDEENLPLQQRLNLIEGVSEFQFANYGTALAGLQATLALVSVQASYEQIKALHYLSLVYERLGEFSKAHDNASLAHALLTSSRSILHELTPALLQDRIDSLAQKGEKTR